MNDAQLRNILDLGFTVLSIGLERQTILDRVAGMQREGASPEQIAEALRQMRDEAIAKAEASSR